MMASAGVRSIASTTSGAQPSNAGQYLRLIAMPVACPGGGHILRSPPVGHPAADVDEPEPLSPAPVMAGVSGHHPRVRKGHGSKPTDIAVLAGRLLTGYHRPDDRTDAVGADQHRGAHVAAVGERGACSASFDSKPTTSAP